MPLYASKYTLELWTRQGTLLADLSGKARNRQLTLSRNQPDDLAFDLDLDEFEQYCADIGVRPRDMLVVNSVEVRIKRLAKYLSGGQLNYLNVSLTARNNTITCRVRGFLQLFSKRFTGETLAGIVLETHTTDYGTAKSRKDLAQYLVSASQALTNGSFGITAGPNQSTNATTYNKAYARTNIKDALQDLTKLQTAPIDIEFTYDKKFNTYDYMGSDRPDIVFEFPSDNFVSMDIPTDGTDMTNEAIGIGRGAADGTQVIDVQPDLASQATYALRQDTVNSNGTDNSDNGITDAAKAELQARSQPIRIPAFTIKADDFPTVTDFGIGDRVRVKIAGHSMVDDINGMYRVEKMTIKIGDDDSEEVTLEVSNL